MNAITTFKKKGLTDSKGHSSVSKSTVVSTITFVDDAVSVVVVVTLDTEAVLFTAGTDTLRSSLKGSSGIIWKLS